MINKVLDRILLAIEHAELSKQLAGMGYTASEAERFTKASNKVRMEAQNDTGTRSTQLAQEETNHSTDSIAQVGNRSIVSEDLRPAAQG